MFHSTCLIFIFFVYCVHEGASEEYTIGFNAEIKSCDGFKNEFINGDNMKLAKSTEESEVESMCMEGNLDFLSNIEEGFMMSLEISKETDMGSELLWSCSMGFCESIDDDDAPWKPVFEALDITGCPVSAGKREVANLSLALGFAEDYVNHNYVGEYLANLKLENNQKDTKSCHVLGIVIKEVEEK